jgi:RsmE family RNA methyltransferase
MGPEGGFTDYEVDKLQQQGFTSFSLGARILRVETAIPIAISQLMRL